VNRQRRALLTILIVGLLVVLVWLSRRATPDSTSTPPTAVRPTIGPGGAIRIASPVSGGTLTASARSEPQTFNRMAAPLLPTELFTLLTQAKLVRINRATWQLEPWLAEKWTTSPDNLTYTLTLRDGLKWSDGAPFSSADVLFSFEAAYQDGGVVASALMVGGKPLTASAPDTRTVIVTYPARFVPGVRLLDNLPIYPKHKLEAALRAGKFHAAWSPTTAPGDMPGLGPFKLAEYVPGQRLVYDRNPNYWRKDEQGTQLPYLDRVVIELVPQQDAEMVRLQSGQIDLTQQPLRAEDVDTFRRLEEQGKARLFDLGVATEGDHFFFNLRPAKWATDPRRAWLPRKEFRQAISHAVDREDFANTVYLGEGVPIHGPITPGNPDWFWSSVPRYQFSLDKARALLESIGLRNRDEDEWLEDANGGEARFTLLAFGLNLVVERAAQVLRDDLRRVGIAMDVVALAPNQVIQRVTSGDFDAALVTFQFSDTDPANNLDYWLSSGTQHFWNPDQKTPATDWERQIDELMQKQAVTDDRDERKKLFNDAQRIFSENLPMIYFAAPRVYIAVSPRVTTMTPSVTRPQVLWNGEAVSIAAGSGRPAS
jgi:peptide/nickel transport system substrate-binding protein